MYVFIKLGLYYEEWERARGERDFWLIYNGPKETWILSEFFGDHKCNKLPCLNAKLASFTWNVVVFIRWGWSLPCSGKRTLYDSLKISRLVANKEFFPISTWMIYRFLKLLILLKTGYFQWFQFPFLDDLNEMSKNSN